MKSIYLDKTHAGLFTSIALAGTSRRAFRLTFMIVS